LNFPFYKQQHQMDCGPACLRMVAQHYGRYYNMETLRQRCQFNKEGVSLLGISDAAETLGFRTRGVKITYAGLVKEASLPCIAHWGQSQCGFSG
jgi:ATP-binding cassette, subfamily B, bacterial